MILLEYWKNLAVMFITFVLPIMPFVMIWDGTVSCLRCRLPFEVLDLSKQQLKSVLVVMERPWRVGVSKV
jgi:hypothetical protein